MKKVTLKDIANSWDGVIARLENKNSKVAHFLEEAKPHSFDGEQALIELKNGMPFHLKTLEKDVGLIESILYDILDHEIKIKFYLSDNSEKRVEKKHNKEDGANNNKELMGRAHSIITELSKELEEKTSEHDEYKKDIAKYKEMAEDKIDFYDAAVGSDDWKSMDEVAKTLNFEGWGRNDMFKFLREGGILRTYIGHNHPYQQYVDRGYFKLIEELYKDKKGSTRIYLKTVVSQKGINWIRKQLDVYISNV